MTQPPGPYQPGPPTNPGPPPDQPGQPVPTSPAPAPAPAPQSVPPAPAPYEQTVPPDPYPGVAPQYPPPYPGAAPPYPISAVPGGYPPYFQQPPAQRTGLVVTVIVTSFNGPYPEQIRVVGEAAKPQALPYRQGMTLLDLMIAVGGQRRHAVRSAGTRRHPRVRCRLCGG